MQKSVNVGIDLGTTNTLVCTDIKGKIKCLKFKNGNGVTLPSVLYYENGEILIGKKADEDGYLNPGNVIRSSKTYIGSERTYNIEGKVFTPTAVATEILKSVKENVYKYIKKDGYDESTVINAVITVPAYFQGNQYDATKRAAIEAGINVLQIITEPTAAAISYITESGSDLDGKGLLVVDIGGGTFDLSYLKYDMATNEYRTIAVDGDKRLGGDDFDEAIKQAMVDVVYADTNLDLANLKASGMSELDYYRAISKLHKEARRVKEELSDSEEVGAAIPDLLTYKGKDYTFNVQWTRDEFNGFCQEIYDKIFNKMNQFLKDNNIQADDIWRVALAGGSCSIPYIGERIQEMFPNKVFSDMDLSTLVAMGAYTVAASIGGGMTTNKPKISDILSHSLGVKADNAFSEMLPRYSPYPLTYTKTFTTSKNNQKSVSIEIYETKDMGGEDKRNLANCELLGLFTLSNIRKAKKGEVKIDVTFEYDDSRILKVTARDQDTGATQDLIIEYDKKEIQRKLDETSFVEPMNIFFAIDASGSMGGSKMNNTKLAARNLIENVIDLSIHKAGIVSFGINSVARMECKLTHNKNQLLTAVDSLWAYGGTPLAEALEMIDGEFQSGENNYVICLTDGMPNSVQKSYQAADQLKNHGVTILSVGAGISGDANATNVLKNISSQRENGTPFLWLTDNVNEISEIFEQIIGEISEM